MLENSLLDQVLTSHRQAGVFDRDATNKCYDSDIDKICPGRSKLGGKLDGCVPGLWGRIAASLCSHINETNCLVRTINGRDSVKQAGT